MKRSLQFVSLAIFAFVALLHGQTGPYTPVPLDPTRDLPASSQFSHPLLPEQYIWTAGDITVRRPDRSKSPWSRTDLRIAPHFFRVHFAVNSLPRAATLYLAGPREAHVYVNGRLLGGFSSNTDAPINFRVFHFDARSALRIGENVLAIQAIRGRGVVSGAGPIETQQLAYGEVLAAKLVPAAFGVEAPALTFTDPSWRSSAEPAAHWSDAAFDDSRWSPVATLGPVESNADLLQWSADAGMYGWPGYLGMSPHLRTYSLPPAAVTHVFAGNAVFGNLDALTSPASDRRFTVTYPAASSGGTDAESPQLLLDFGREVAGRLLVESASPHDAVLSIAYGESEIEALATGLTSGQQGGNYLGTNLLDVPANGIARGPKSGFRYVRIRFLPKSPVSGASASGGSGSGESMAFKSIRLEGIYEPVRYLGSFASSDPLLDRIWETGAYTAHLCMQDGLWDAPKRDRGRWVGDIDIEGRVISTVFGSSDLVKETLRRLAEATPSSQYVNGIASYSALWITSLDNLYQHTGDREFLASQHAALLRILGRLDQDLDADGAFNPHSKGWGFVDWAPGLYGFTPETRIGTSLQYLRGYRAAVDLLKELGDREAADRYSVRLQAISAASKSLFDPATKTLGSTWQLNALAVLNHAEEPSGDAIWSQVLSHVKQDAPTDQVISPYFNAYLLDAMAALGHHAEALAWIRSYWGGMLAEGATSFWESYDLRWPKTNPHLSLQADGTSGYFVSLAHGWSSGPTAWITENILGVTPASPGYATVRIEPHLLGLDFARGSVPTPHGVIAIGIDRQKGVALDLPAGISRAAVVLQLPDPAKKVYLDGSLTACNACDKRSDAPATYTIEIDQPGHHTIEVR